ncbi:RNA polymerase sigma factor [Phenylobacterium sp.]|uniref:RNA polymerase sigma factor n=1 Tax=Phenylobacterium sp. TaxID=1871053 RepID=UPI002734F7C7|nr:RNA polymerase sigma factor [Phenylobacterium sp.]MDP3852615.1 RNA polymerase sigma factor [Phenylobacterium sp.]
MAARGDDIETRLTALIPRLHRFAWMLTGASADADDVTQATLERALIHRRELSEGAHLEAWVIRVARNIWLDQLRRRRVRDVAVDPAMLGPGHDEKEDLRMQGQEALAAFATLPPGQKEIATLVLVEGYTYHEAATALEIPIGTVMSRLARARRALAERLLGPEDAPLAQGAGG